MEVRMNKSETYINSQDVCTKIQVLERENQFLKVEIEQLKNLAYYDSLTKLANRFSFYEQIKVATNSCIRNKEKLAILFIDLDGFKLINDSYGHKVGDWILIKVAECLRNVTRNSDIVARFGGDEFVVGLTAIKIECHAQIVANKIINALSQIKNEDGINYNIKASIGICLCPDNSAYNIQDVLRKSDLAMYQAKQHKDFNVLLYSKKVSATSITAY